MQALYECPDEGFVHLIVGVGDKMTRNAPGDAVVCPFPAIDKRPIEQCDIVLQVLPCMVLRKGARVIACSAVPSSPLRIRAQLLGADREEGNIYGYAFAAEVLEIPSYQNLLQRELTLRLPYNLASEFIPDLSAREDVAADFVPSEWSIDIKVRRSGALPLPVIYRKDIIRVSLSLSDQTGGLILGDYAPPVNSRSHPNRVYVGTTPLAGRPHRDSNFHGDYFELAGLQDTLPVTNGLATNFSEAHDALLLSTDPDQVKAMRRSQQYSLR